MDMLCQGKLSIDYSYLAVEHGKERWGPLTHLIALARVGTAVEQQAHHSLRLWKGTHKNKKRPTDYHAMFLDNGLVEMKPHRLANLYLRRRLCVARRQQSLECMVQGRLLLQVWQVDAGTCHFIASADGCVTHEDRLNQHRTHAELKERMQMLSGRIKCPHPAQSLFPLILARLGTAILINVVSCAGGCTVVEEQAS